MRGCERHTVNRLADQRFTVCRSRFIFRPAIRTGGRVAEGVGLENRYTRKGIVGSNPTLSVVLPSLTPRHLNLLITSVASS